MRRHVLFPIMVVMLSMGTASYADRAMTQTEALAILQKLTDSPTAQWIPAGTITATHVERQAANTVNEAEIDAEIQRQIDAYKANPNKIELTPELQKLALEAIPFNVRYRMSNGYSMTSSVTLKYDGSRFSWSIKVMDREDSVPLPSELTTNPAVRSFNRTWNDYRIYTWDGQKYTLQSINCNDSGADRAFVDATGGLPHFLNGPLNAGVIPWGYGKFTSAKLKNAAIKAAEVTRDGKKQVEMTVQPTDGSTMTFALDPEKDNAVTAYTWRGNSKRTVSNQYANHLKKGNTWVPMKIVVEERDLETNEVVKSDEWTFSHVDLTVPRDFTVALNTGAVVEYHSPVGAGKSIYTYSSTGNMDRLLADHLALKAAQETMPQNCASAALKYVASQFGKSVSDQEASKLVGSDGRTNLAVLEEAIRKTGLATRAVQTDLAALKKLDKCKAILHLPGKNHFVVVDSIQGNDAWLVDLSENKFYYRANAHLLPQDWSEGTALLVSAQPVAERFTDLDPGRMKTAVGGGWACTMPISRGGAVYCDAMPDGTDCYGYWQYWEPRIDCQWAYNGTCYQQTLFWFMECPCIPDPMNGEYACNGNGTWNFYYIDCCE